MSSPEVSGVLLERLTKALLGAYDRSDMEQMLRFRLNLSLNELVPVNVPWRTQVFELVTKAERQGWLPQLAVVASDSVPGEQAAA